MNSFTQVEYKDSFSPGEKVRMRGRPGNALPVDHSLTPALSLRERELTGQHYIVAISDRPSANKFNVVPAPGVEKRGHPLAGPGQ